MRKLIATAIAAGALAVGTAASAQDFGSILSGIFGLGGPTYSQTQPAVVAGTQQVYVDQYGRRFYYDQYGRAVILQDQQQQQIVGYDQWGRPVYGHAQTQQQIVGYDQWGRPIYGYSQSNQTPHYAYGNRSWDRDGDGVANSRDRWPDDRRYW